MSPAELIPHLRRRPFVPFQIVSSDGRSYAIDHPDLAVTLPSSVMVLRPNPELPGAYLGMDFVSMFHIVRLEQNEGVAGSQGNGTGSQ